MASGVPQAESRKHVQPMAPRLTVRATGLGQAVQGDDRQRPGPANARLGPCGGAEARRDKGSAGPDQVVQGVRG